MEPIFDKSHGERNQWCLGNRSEIDQVYYAEFDLGTYLDSNRHSTPTKAWDFEYMLEHSKKIWGE